MVEVEAGEREARPPELTLAVGAGDRDRFALAGGESRRARRHLGRAARDRAQPRASPPGCGTRTWPKLRRAALEAIKQCGAAWALRGGRAARR